MKTINKNDPMFAGAKGTCSKCGHSVCLNPSDVNLIIWNKSMNTKKQGYWAIMCTTCVTNVITCK